MLNILVSDCLKDGYLQMLHNRKLQYVHNRKLQYVTIYFNMPILSNHWSENFQLV